MNIHEVHQIEKAKWDSLAEKGLSAKDILPPRDDFYTYAHRTNTMAGVTEFLGNLSGKQVLEYGCGLGAVSVLLAKTGAQVTTFDLSAKSVAITQERARLNGVADRITAVVAPGEKLPFGDNTFDIIFGKAILHHINVHQGSPEIYRVLKKGGKAAFVEPMGMNPLLRFARAHLPYPHKNPRGADKPLNYDEINAWGAGYSTFYYKEFHLLSMMERAIGFNKKLPRLRQIDAMLLKHLPPLRRHCRYVTLFMIK